MNLGAAILVDLLPSLRKARCRKDDPAGFPPGPAVGHADSVKVSNTTEEPYRWRKLFLRPNHSSETSEISSSASSHYEGEVTVLNSPNECRQN